jgi:peptide/nickel transport system permease protein
MRVADAFFALPDVLVLMVFGFALQTIGELRPAWRIGDLGTMVTALGLVGWAAPARMLRDRLATLEGEEFVTAVRGLGATRGRILVRHLLPSLRGYLVAIYLVRIPAAIVAESTVSFLGVVRMHTLTLGRYLGTRYEALSYEGGAAVVLPAWLLLLAIVVATRLAARSRS